MNLLEVTIRLSLHLAPGDAILNYFISMLQDPQTIRYYQKLTDALVHLWNRGYRFDDLRLFVDGYLSALRHSAVIEPYQVHRLEEEVTRYLYDPSSFENTPQPRPDYR